jgi:nicotinamidase/pyrazinamidase
MPEAIIIVDVQNDFVEGGALAVKGGRSIIPTIQKLIAELPAELVITTQDWHPLDHSQFEPQGGPWPVHCVQGSKGAELVPELQLPPDSIHIVKGFFPEQDGYSGFEGHEKEGLDTLEALLRNNHIELVYVCGIATDYCVKATALDAVKAGLRVVFVENASVGVADDTVAAARTEMAQAGIQFMKVY